MNWINSKDLNNQPKNDTLIFVFSSIYPKCHPMRTRIIDSTFYKFISEAEYWAYVDLEEPLS